MYGLLISKVDNIRVLQVDESTLNVNHKKAESTKPALKGSLPFKTESGGENKTVDLGAGAIKHRMKIHTLSKTDTDALFDVLYNKRYCTITDKFKGRLDVYIDSVDISDSDKHIGKTIFTINATVQDEEKQPVDSTKSLLKSIISKFESTLYTQSLDFAGVVETVDTILDVLSNTTSFVDANLNIVDVGISKILTLMSVTGGIYASTQSRVNTKKKTKVALGLIKQTPNRFADTMLEISGIETHGNIEVFKTETNTGIVVKSVDDDLSNLSQLEEESVKSVIVSGQLLNLLVAVSDMRQILSTNFTNRDEFNAQVDLCIERLEYTALDYESIVEAQQVLKSFSNVQTIQGLIDYEVEDEKPLTAIVFGIYGNLDNYDAIRDLNNFKDSDAISGTIKVYDVSVS